MNIFTEGLAKTAGNRESKRKSFVRNSQQQNGKHKSGDAKMIAEQNIEDNHVDHALPSNRESQGFQDSDLESLHNHIYTNLN